MPATTGGQELATAIIRFIGDDSQYLASLAQVEASLKGISGVSGAGIGAAGGAAAAAGTSAETAAGKFTLLTKAQVDAEAANLAAVGPALAWSDILGKTGGASEVAAEAEEALGGGVSHATRLVREATGALGLHLPMLEKMEAGSTGAARGLHEFGLGMVFAGAAVLAGAAIVGHYLEQGRAMTEAQLAANEAIATLDTAGAQSQLAKASTAVRAYERDLELTRQGTGTMSQNFAATVGALTTSGAQLMAIMLTAADAAAQTWEFFGRGVSVLQTDKSEADALAKSFALMATTAPSVEALASALDQQSDAVRKSAVNTIELEKAQDRQYAAKVQQNIRLLTGAENADIRAKLQDDLDEEMADRAKQRTNELASVDTAAAERKISNAQRVAELNARIIESAGRLLTIQAESAAKTVQFDAAEVESRQHRVEADSKFYDTAIPNLDEYQARKRADLATDQSLAAARIAITQQTERAAMDARLAGLTGPALIEARGKSVALDAQQAAERLALEQEYTLKAEELGNKQLDASRTNAQRELSIEAGRFSQQAALQQGSLSEHIAFLARVSQSDAASIPQREQYQREYFTTVRGAEAAAAAAHQAMGQSTAAEDLARLARRVAATAPGDIARITATQEYAAAALKVEDLVYANFKAKGQLTTADEVAFLAKRTQHFQVGSQEWIKAETAWATAARAANEQAASSGTQFLLKIGAEVAATHGGYVSLSDVTKQYATDQKKAQETLDTLASGGKVRFTDLQQAMDFSKTWGDFAKQGRTAGENIDKGIGDAQNALKGLTTQITGSDDAALKQLGEQAAHAFDAVKTTIPETFASAFDTVQLIIGGALATSLNFVDDFFEALNSKAQAGISTFADTVYSGLIGRLQQALDDQAARS